MLTHLSVKNYALIDILELDLHNGFSVITGETGAGKSIILGALNLVLGKRADLKVLRQPDTKCVVEATFTLQANSFQHFFAEHELDYEHETIIRREITPSGKSRAFINDTPVNLSVLNELSDKLIDVHSQHQNLLLAQTDFQLSLLDAFGNHTSAISTYAKAHEQYLHLSGEIKRIKQSSDRQSIDLDYVNFLLKELTEAQLEAGEQEAIEEELRTLEHAEEIQEKLNLVAQLIEGEHDGGIEASLASIAQSLRQLQHYQQPYKELAERVNALHIELEDIRQEVAQRANDTEHNPERQARLDDRLSALIHLQRKHQVSSVEELIAKRDELNARLDEVTHAQEKLDTLKHQLQAAATEREAAALALHQARAKVAPEIEKAMQRLLAELNMKDASLKIEVTQGAHFTKLGNDQVVFNFSANKGMALRPLAKIASGGEMSRVMLALKSIMAKNSRLASIIFDEIDTGVSGETAGKIGTILSKMGAHMQVIAITHLPQIAAMGNHHYQVKKKSEANTTLTDIVQLNDEQRLHEVARMLSGEHITEAALANARHLMTTNDYAV